MWQYFHAQLAGATPPFLEPKIKGLQIAMENKPYNLEKLLV